MGSHIDTLLIITHDYSEDVYTYLVYDVLGNHGESTRREDQCRGELHDKSQESKL